MCGTVNENVLFIFLCFDECAWVELCGAQRSIMLLSFSISQSCILSDFTNAKHFALSSAQHVHCNLQRSLGAVQLIALAALQACCGCWRFTSVNPEH